MAELTVEQKRALALARARAKAATPSPRGDASIQADADLAERITGTGTFADITGSGIAKAIPFGDEIVSAVNAPFRATREFFQGEGFDIPRAYGRNVALEDELQRRRQERSPMASTAGAVAGGIGAASPLVKGGFSFLQGAKPTIGSLTGRGAAEGAAYGGVYGAGEGRGLDERLANAAFGGGVGALTGGALGGVGRIGAGGKAKAPNIEELTAAKDTAYAVAEQAGVAFTPKAVTGLSRKVVDELVDMGFDPALQPGAAAAVRRIRALQGQNVTLKGLDTIRKVASNGYIPGNKSNNKAVSKIIDAIDDVIANPGEGGVLMGDAARGAEALKEARSLASRIAKSERLSQAIDSAERRAASTGSGGNMDNLIRQRAARILENPRGFSKAEKEALEKIARGGNVQNALRLVGKLSPAGSGLMAALGIGGTMVNPGIGALALGGMGAKTVADAMTRGNVSAADALIRSGGILSNQPLTPIRQGILEALIGSTARELPANISP